MYTCPNLQQLLDEISNHHPRSVKGLQEAMKLSPARFAKLAELFLGWAVTAFGEDAIPRMVGAFVQFSTDVNLAQARYEGCGHYEHRTFSDCFESVYSIRETMDDYLLGVYLTNFLWAHHLEISCLFEDRFLSALGPKARLLEIAPGHGGWGLWALHCIPEAQLLAYDISPSSLTIASALARAAGVSDRAQYRIQNALELRPESDSLFDACICCFLIEHLEEPSPLFQVLVSMVKPGGLVFLAGALTAAQVDHICEFRRESELVVLAEKHGFRVLELRSVNPRRTLPHSKFLPRSVALILQKRTHDTW